jgi:O-antigen/teichoic acid export membrane protein
MAALPPGFRRSALSNYATTGTSVLVALLTVPLLTSGLGPEAYGIWVLVGATVLYLELLEFGFGATTIKFVAAANARDDEEGVRTAIATSFWLLAVPGLVALLLGLGLAAGFPVLFDVPAELEGPTRLLLLLLAVDLALSIPGDCFGGTLIALQRYDLLNLTLIVVSLAQALSWAVVLAAGGGLVELGVVTVVLSLLGQLARYLLVRRLVPGMSLDRRHVARELVRPYAGKSVWFSLSEVSSVVISRIDAVVVGAVAGVAAAGTYAIGQKLALLAERAASPVLGVFFPHAAALSAQGDAEGARAAALLGLRIATAVGLPLTLVLALFAEPAIEVWVGPRYAGAALVVVYLSAATALTVVTEAPRLMLYGGEAIKGAALVQTAEAALNLLLSVVLGRAMGLEGVALATLLSAGAGTVFGLVPYACRVIGLPQRQVYGTVLRGHLLPAAGTAALALLLLRTDLDRLLPLLAAGALCGGVYLALLAVTGLSAAERSEVRRRLAERRGAPA